MTDLEYRLAFRDRILSSPGRGVCAGAPARGITGTSRRRVGTSPKSSWAAPWNEGEVLDATYRAFAPGQGAGCLEGCSWRTRDGPARSDAEGGSPGAVGPEGGRWHRGGRTGSWELLGKGGDAGEVTEGRMGRCGKGLTEEAVDLVGPMMGEGRGSVILGSVQPVGPGIQDINIGELPDLGQKRRELGSLLPEMLRRGNHHRQQIRQRCGCKDPAVRRRGVLRSHAHLVQGTRNVRARFPGNNPT